ncbi:MAG: hypothetical protein AB8F65_02325 [Woeseiaceae bacterium]
MKLITILTFLGTTIALAGCGAPNMCEQRTDYQQVRESGKIRVPAELDPLPDVTQLEIPVSSTPPDVDKTCLERPPSFFEKKEAAE